MAVFFAAAIVARNSQTHGGYARCSRLGSAKKIQATQALQFTGHST